MSRDKCRRDYTGHFGDLFTRTDKPAWPMYSYSRPAYLFWNGFANRMHELNYSDEQIGVILGSTYMRHGLDQFQDQIEQAGVTFAHGFTTSDFREMVGLPKGATKVE